MDSEILQSLSRAKSLFEQFTWEGGRHLIDEAIAFGREALELCSPDHPMRADSVTSLSSHLGLRYEQFGDMNDIEEGIRLCRAALQICPPGHPNRHVSLDDLAKGLSTRYNQLGATDDLDEAIALGRESLALDTLEDRDQSVSLNNLGVHLYKRYQKLDAMEDLDESISYAQDSLSLCPRGHPFRSYPLNILAISLLARYDKLGAIDDLDEAIVMHQEALDLRPPGHTLRSTSLNNLSVALHSRYHRLGEIDDLDEAIVLKRQALDLRPPGHYDRSTTLIGLSAQLYERYMKLGKMDDLNEAIVLDKEAVELRPLGHPYRSQSLDDLAVHLLARFRHSHQSHDKEESFSVYARLVDISHTVSYDLLATKRWINAAEYFKHCTTVLAYETYFRQLVHHLTALPSLSRHLDIIKDLASSLAQDTFSAALRNHYPTKAVELLEQGRGVFLGQLGRLRSPVDDVVASGSDGKALGDQFLQLTSDIRMTLQSPGAAYQHDHVCHLNVQLQRVVSKIRKLPGFSHFLQPPPFPHLRKAAIHGPVVIVNASKYSCDALVVFFDRDPVHIPLQISRDEVREMTSELLRLTKQTKITNVGKYFAVVMRELWKKVVSSIVDVLRANHPTQSRVWWCPTAEFSVIPLHAAGMYRMGQPRFSDFYISSYTSSLAALIQARQNQASSSPAKGKYFVGIGQGKAAGESELHSIADELTAIGERLDGQAMFTRMEGSASTITNVMEALEQNDWVHLACHGLPNKKQPFESAFGLYDGHLTVERLLHCNLRNAEFAYLSACHTTVGDEDCLDEMIHLASAMQFAGFRSVIGTMWAVDDEQTVKITSKFYEKMVNESGRLDHTCAAYALHNTMRELQGLSFDQRILYVHFGA